jgi:sulfate/thiosulfate-binding protein
MKSIKLFATGVVLYVSAGLGAGLHAEKYEGPKEILNASYDVARALYQDLNPAFSAYYQKKYGENVEVKQSHAGSTRQARAVIDGLDADVVALNQITDIDALVRAGLVDENWKAQFPHNSFTSTSITAFIVRKGNPKNIKDWGDLIKPDVKIALVNPKTGGNGRYTFLAAYGYALRQYNGDRDKANEFVKKLYLNVPVLDQGGNAATTTFVQRQIGDVLITFEAETFLIRSRLGEDSVDVVVPSVTIQADFPVAIINRTVEKRGSGPLAKEYLNWLFTEEAQEIFAKNYYRPVVSSVLSKYQDQFPKTELVDVEKEFGGFEKANKEFFADGGIFDQIYTKGR